MISWFCTAGMPDQPGRLATTAGALAAVGGLVVGQEDELRLGRDDVLLRQLRVTAVGGLARGVGDVLQPEQADDLPDERGRGGRVVRVGAQLPVVGRALVRGAGLRHGVAICCFMSVTTSVGLAGVAGRLADLLDLRVRGVQGGDGRLDQHRDAELAHPADQAARVLRGDDQGRVVLGDRLDVRGEAGQAGLRHARRVVGVLVDGDDLRSRRRSRTGPRSRSGRARRSGSARRLIVTAAVGGGHGDREDRHAGRTRGRGAGRGRGCGRGGRCCRPTSSRPATAAAATAASDGGRRAAGGFSSGATSSRYKREGRRDRRPAGSDARGGRDGSPFPRGSMSSGAAGVDLAWTPRGGIVTVAGQRRNGPLRGLHRLRSLTRHQPAGG